MQPKQKLQVANGYDLDFPQTARLLQWLDEADLPKWNRRSAADSLGLAERMVENIMSLSQAMGLVQPRSGRPTALGHAIRQMDPYLSGELTPWVIHYNLGANPAHLVWYRMVNEVIPSRTRLTVAEARECFDDLRQTHSARSASKHVQQELKTFFDAYTEGPLSRIAYIYGDDGVYSVPSALKVPPAAFGYALLTYAAVYRAGETAIPIEDVVRAGSSPGRVFLMRDADVRQRLEAMHQQNLLNIESRAHLDQVRFVKAPDAVDFLASHYADPTEAL